MSKWSGAFPQKIIQRFLRSSHCNDDLEKRDKKIKKTFGGFFTQKTPKGGFSDQKSPQKSQKDVEVIDEEIVELVVDLNEEWLKWLNREDKLGD